MKNIINKVLDINYITERDMDLLIIEEIYSSMDFRNIFLNKVGRHNLEIISAHHSLTDILLGESDITVIFKNGSKKYAILIEDKINAIAMQKQFERYVLRGEKGILDGQYDEFDVYICAPKSYLDINTEAHLYPNKISYEELLEYFEKKSTDRSAYKSTIINNALIKKSDNYSPIPNEDVTTFHKKYKDFCVKKYNYLNVYLNAGTKGSKSSWMNFKTKTRGNRITHKTEMGFVDLMIYGLGDNINAVKSSIGEILDADMIIEKASKSASIRLLVPEVDVHRDFFEQIKYVEIAMIAVERLQKIASHIEFRKFIALKD